MAKKVGRPSLGITKKVSLTLSESQWQDINFLMANLEKNQSSTLRYIIEEFIKNNEVFIEDEEEQKEPIQIKVVKFAYDGKVHIQNKNYKTYCGSLISPNTLTKTVNLEEVKVDKLCKNCLRLLK